MGVTESYQTEIQGFKVIAEVKMRSVHLFSDIMGDYNTLNRDVYFTCGQLGINHWLSDIQYWPNHPLFNLLTSSTRKEIVFLIEKGREYLRNQTTKQEE